MRIMSQPDALRRTCKHEKIMALIMRIMEIPRKCLPVIFLRAFFYPLRFVQENTDLIRFSRPWFVPFYRSFGTTMSVGSYACLYPEIFRQPLRFSLPLVQLNLLVCMYSFCHPVTFFAADSMRPYGSILSAIFIVNIVDTAGIWFSFFFFLPFFE